MEINSNSPDRLTPSQTDVSLRNEETSTTPNASFTFTIAQSGTDYQVSFADTSVANGIGVSINSWSWNFGDGNTSTQQNPVHNYSMSGNSSYSVQLTVGQDTGGSSSATNVVPFTTELELLLVGGGGSGARGSYNPQGNGAGGGAGAAYFMSGSNKITVPIYTDLNFSVGAGGVIPGFGARGNNGAQTIFTIGSSQYHAGGGGGGGGGSGGGDPNGKNNTDGVDAPLLASGIAGGLRGNGGGGGVYFFYQGLGGDGTHQGYTSSGSSGHGAGVNGQGSTYTSIGPGQDIGLSSGDHDKTFRSVTSEVIGQGGNGQPMTSSSPITNNVTGAGSGGYGGQSNPNFYGQGNVPEAGEDGAVYIRVPEDISVANASGWSTDLGNYTYNNITYNFYYVTSSGSHTIQIAGNNVA